MKTKRTIAPGEAVVVSHPIRFDDLNRLLWCIRRVARRARDALTFDVETGRVDVGGES